MWKEQLVARVANNALLVSMKRVWPVLLQPIDLAPIVLPVNGVMAKLAHSVHQGLIRQVVEPLTASQ